MKHFSKKNRLLLVSCLLLLVAFHADAAEIFFGTHSKDIGVGSTFEVGVFIDTNGQSVNAVEGRILFPEETLELAGLYTGNSMLNLWIEQPVLVSEGTVSFSGVVPGGFAGEKGYLFSLVFKASRKGDPAISVSYERVLLNDGNGSEAKLTKAPMELHIAEGLPVQTFQPPLDDSPPESFTPTVGRDPSVFGGKYFLAFTAQDKGSGINHYEVKEKAASGSFKGIFSRVSWVTTDSPYLLEDQSLKSVLQVKAVDTSGNQRVAQIPAPNPLPWYENYIVWSIIVIITAIIFVGYKAWKKRSL